MADAARREAEKLIAKAKGEMGTFFLWRSSDSFRQAAKYYVDAGAQYKIATDFDKAAECFLTASEIFQEKAQDRAGHLSSLVEAATTFRLSNPQRAVETYEKVITLYQAQNRAPQAAKFSSTMGEIYEKELFDGRKAADAYKQAAYLYSISHSTASQSGELSKAAAISATSNEYTQAIKLYEEIAELQRDSGSAMQHNINTSLYKALLCSMVSEALSNAGLLDHTTELLESYQQQYPSFENHDDVSFIHEVIDAYNNRDIAAFTKSIGARRYKLDNWSQELFYTLKRSIEGSLAPSETVSTNITNADGTLAEPEETPDFT